jgi:RNA polymerase sigma factor (sigma-70 family)
LFTGPVEQQEVAVTFEQYARHNLPTLRSTARAISADASLADDLVQEVLIKLSRDWSRISGSTSFDAYVRRMLVNEFLSWRRKWARLVPMADPTVLLDAASHSGPDETSRLDEHEALLAEVRGLPGRQRVVVGLRYFADYSDEQIAEALGCSQSTVRVHAARALASLRVSRAADLLIAATGILP